MANYHLEISVISRWRNRSIARAINYISGRTIEDKYNGGVYGRSRTDVLFHQTFLPPEVPAEYRDLQFLCDEIDLAEVRYDARTARVFKGSLPNELSSSEQIRIVSEFVMENFVSRGLCAIAAIHEGRNEADPSRNNPHAHIIVPTRTIGSDGFNKRKDRESDRRDFVNLWRESWATVQNRAYERTGLDVRVSHDSLEVQGIHNREPTIHLSRADWQREMQGVRTAAGNRKRAIQERNKEKMMLRNRERNIEIDRSR